MLIPINISPLKYYYWQHTW